MGKAGTVNQSFKANLELDSLKIGKNGQLTNELYWKPGESAVAGVTRILIISGCCRKQQRVPDVTLAIEKQPDSCDSNNSFVDYQYQFVGPIGAWRQYEGINVEGIKIVAELT